MNILALLSRLSSRDRRTILWGVAAITAITLFGKGIPFLIRWRTSSAAEATEMLGEAQRADMAIAAFSTLRDTLRARAPRAQQLDSLLVSGATPAAAAATLVSLVTSAATDASVKPGAIEAHVDSAPPARNGRKGAAPHVFTRVSARGEITGDVVGLAQFLSNLEHGPTLLAVRALSINQSDVAGGMDRMEILHATFTIEGLSRPDHQIRDASRSAPLKPEAR